MPHPGEGGGKGGFAFTSRVYLNHGEFRLGTISSA